MRILLLSECYPSQEKTQYGIFIKQQFDELKMLGNDITVVVPVREENGSFAMKSITDSVGSRFILYYHTDRYEIFLRQAARKISALIEQIGNIEDFNLISVQISSDFILQAAVCLGEKYHIPVVQHYHGLNVFEEFVSVHPLRQKLYGHRRKKLIDMLDGVVGVSEKVSDIVRNECQNTAVYTVYNGVNAENFVNKKELKPTFDIIGVGNLIPIKGFDFLIRAFSVVKQSVPNAKLHIIGDGIESDSLKKLSDQVSVADDTFFYGSLPYSEVAKKMARADVFVLPSFYEALGCVYLEAMSCGLPTIGVKGMGIDEIIQNGENGFLVPPKDAAKIAQVLIMLSSAPELCRQIGCKARETAEKYTWRASAEKLNSVYNEVRTRIER